MEIVNKFRCLILYEQNISGQWCETCGINFLADTYKNKNPVKLQWKVEILKGMHKRDRLFKKQMELCGSTGFFFKNRRKLKFGFDESQFDVLPLMKKKYSVSKIERS